MKRKVHVLIIFLFIILMIMASMLISPLILSLGENSSSLKLWLSQNGILGSLVFIGLMVLQVFAAFIPGEPLEIATGYLYGSIWGSLLCLLGAQLGSILIFLLVKRYREAVVSCFVSQEQFDKMKFLQNESKLNSLLFGLFLIPGTPKDILTYIIALSKMKLSTFLAITTVARIPSIISSTIGGAELMQGNYGVAVALFLFTGILSLTGVGYYNYYLKYRKAESEFYEETFRKHS